MNMSNEHRLTYYMYIYKKKSEYFHSLRSEF